MPPRFIVLSHPLRADAPTWPGNPPAAEIELRDAIERGDVANTTVLRLFSHSGTHVDTPWHFNPNGPAAWQLPIERFVFEAPRLLDLPCSDSEAITRARLEAHSDTIAAADLLLLRTGWAINRPLDPRRFVEDGPLLDPEAAHWLVDRHPDLRAIATDAVSIGSPSQPEVSVEIHHALTGVGRADGRFVLIYEDVDIVPEVARAIRIYAWPLFIDGADGSPVTIVAELAS